MAARNISNNFKFPVIVRRLLLSWLSACTISYLVLSHPLKNLNIMDGIAQMSIAGIAVMTAIFFIATTIIGCYQKNNQYERWLILCVFILLAGYSIFANFTWPFLFANLILIGILIIYAVKGWDYTATNLEIPSKSPAYPKFLLYILTTAFVLFVSVWTVCRIYSFCTPTYDFGIFSQMFYNMKTSGIPFTTVERDGLLSHFQVHVSPIYYLLLPVYYLFPFPATLQVLQALILGSSVIPLWLLCRRHDLTPTISLIATGILLVYPAFSAGTSYDIHENAFLAPLILWLLYGMDAKNVAVSILSAILTLLVKEDSAVYVAIIALYLIIRSALKRNDPNRKWGLLVGLVLFIGAVSWFIIVTKYLSIYGDGVMTYRYQNMMANNSGSLIGVIHTILLCPEKMILECVDPEKLKFIFLTLFPLLGLPFLTRKYERYILLIPYILINLISDYQYQHDIFFQYTFGSTAFLLYLTVVNLADLKNTGKQFIIASASFLLSLILLIQHVVPVAMRYPRLVKNNGEHYKSIRQTLSLIPDDASVAATTFYTTQLSQREILYDVKYTSIEHLLSAEYVALAIHSETNYKQYEKDGDNGYENLVMLLESNGYTVFAELDDTLVIYRK